MESYMDLKVVCQKKEANEKNALGPFIHCRGKTPGTNRLMVYLHSLIIPAKRLCSFNHVILVSAYSSTCF